MKRFEVDDDRVRQKFPMHLHFKVMDTVLLGKILKKVVRMSGSTTPLIPDFTEDELKLSEELWTTITSMTE